jgi:hypothetical protein
MPLSKQTNETMKQMALFHAAKPHYLPSMLAYVDSNRGEFVPGPQVNVSPSFLPVTFSSSPELTGIFLCSFI